MTRLATAALLIACAGCSAPSTVQDKPGTNAPPAGSPPPAPLRVLALSATAGFRHDSIPAARQTLQTIAAAHGFTLTLTENPSDLNAASLAATDVLVFLLTSGELPFDAYTLYYVGQAIYQVGGQHWDECYPTLRDQLVASQSRDSDPRRGGQWRDTKHLGGKPAELYGTAVGCFILAIPNRYLPILQEGRIENLKNRFTEQTAGGESAM